ncbi:MAG: flagellar hook-basal body complex protein [bacterium]
MVEGLYIGSSTLSARAQELDVIANNIANINTPGFKKEEFTFQSFLNKELTAFSPAVNKAAQTYNLDPSLLDSIIQAESSGNPNAVSPKGAKGLMQLMDSTASMMGVNDSFDPEENVLGGAKYFRSLLDQFGDVKLALAAYNAGPGTVKKYNGIPPYKETQKYVDKVLAGAQTLKKTPSFPTLQGYTNFDQGELETTSGKLDFAIEGKGLFKVTTPEGPKYTRAGSFALNDEGTLVTSHGYPVLGEGGEISIKGNELSVSKRGEITVDNELIDKFIIKSFDKFEKDGNNLFTGIGEEKDDSEFSILQGYIEKSNLNPMKELIHLTELLRAYENCQSVVATQDATLDLLINQVGRR